MNGNFPRVLLAAMTVALALPAAASAKIIEVGEVGEKFPPSCPTNGCEVISRTTAYQTRVAGERRQFVAPADGRVVAWTISLGKPRKRVREYFEDTLGGPAQAGITILRPGERHFGRVTAESPLISLTPFFGTTAQFPLVTSLAVNEGDIIALTVPTWAPALGLGLGRNSVWRASRNKEACADTQKQSAQTDLRDLAQYKCVYRTARLTYSATLITTPVPPDAPKS